MKGTIVNYRIGRRTQDTNQLIVSVDGCSTKEAASKLIGNKVTWKTPSGKEIVGKVASAHGAKGTVRIRFNKGLPGQALGTAVELG
ncbi:MAG: 50S ribosomal protein L35ae [Candidatus Altiarchaeales archaeon IMC4]|nr:MAG: 50S ribosomal protein L35ae [Candidatus Altiarchaeales archaeon IMC4]